MSLLPVHRAHRWSAILVLAALLSAPVPLRAAEPAPGPGTTLDSLKAGSTTYQQVRIRSVNARTLVILHRGGMASIPLKSLDPEWQARFHYDPAAEVAPEPAPVVVAPKPPRPALAAPRSRFDEMLRQFGRPADVRREVDLRPKFLQLELGVKNQGYRPSCAIFAIVSALEYQNAELVGHAEKFSEEYLIWAVCRATRRVGSPALTDAAIDEGSDFGFALGEVVEALRAYGIPLQSSMPNTFGLKISAIEDPPAAIVEEARKHQRVFVHELPGRDNATRINNLVCALNTGVPIAVGLGWPNFRTIRTGYLSGQKPLADGGHAVTITGYRSATGRIEDAVFMFKNSWGPTWGQGGYGTVTYDYLNKNLYEAVLLEVQADPAGRRS